MADPTGEIKAGATLVSAPEVGEDQSPEAIIRRADGPSLRISAESYLLFREIFNLAQRQETEGKPLTPPQVAFAIWLAQPDGERKPPTQNEFAKLIGYSPQALCAWKKLRPLMQLAAALSEIVRDQLTLLARQKLPKAIEGLARGAERGKAENANLLMEIAFAGWKARPEISVNISLAQAIREAEEELKNYAGPSWARGAIDAEVEPAALSESSEERKPDDAPGAVEVSDQAGQTIGPMDLAG